MKVFVPRNIQKGWFKMNFQMGPISVTLIQLILLAVGMAVALVIWNSMVKSGSTKTVAAVVAVPVFLIFVFIAFFKVSELGLVAFIAKLIRTNFLDAPKKFQDDYERIDPADIAIKKSKAAEDQVKVRVSKYDDVNDEKLNKLKKDTLF